MIVKPLAERIIGSILSFLLVPPCLLSCPRAHSRSSRMHLSSGCSLGRADILATLNRPDGNAMLAPSLPRRQIEPVLQHALSSFPEPNPIFSSSLQMSAAADKFVLLSRGDENARNFVSKPLNVRRRPRRPLIRSERPASRNSLLNGSLTQKKIIPFSLPMRVAQP